MREDVNVETIIFSRTRLPSKARVTARVDIEIADPEGAFQRTAAEARISLEPADSSWARADADMTDQPRPVAHRWWSILRLLMQVLAVLVVAIGGWIGWIVYTAKVQHDAVAAIEKAGGLVAYDWELRDGPLLPTPKPEWLKWLVDHLGADCFGTVHSVDLRSKGSDAVLAYVGKLGLLENLTASGPSITDSGLVHLKRLTHLQRLNLGSTAVTDAGLCAPERTDPTLTCSTSVPRRSPMPGSASSED